MKCFKNFTKFYHKDLIFSMLSFSNNLTSVSVYYELHDLFVSHHIASIKVIIDIDIYVLSKNNGLREVLPVFHCRSDGSASSLLNVNMKIPQSLRIEDVKICLGRVWNEVSRNSLVNLCMLSYQSTTKVHNVHKAYISSALYKLQPWLPFLWSVTSDSATPPLLHTRTLVMSNMPPKDHHGKFRFFISRIFLIYNSY